MLDILGDVLFGLVLHGPCSLGGAVIGGVVGAWWFGLPGALLGAVVGLCCGIACDIWSSRER